MSASAQPLPPHDLDAETAVVGSVILDNSVMQVVMEIIGPLGPSAFYDARHAIILHAVYDLISTGQPADLVTIVPLLRERGELDRIGGLDYLIEVQEKTPSAANAEHYARILAQLARRRRIIQSATAVMAKAYNLASDESELAEAVEVVREVAAPPFAAHPWMTQIHSLNDAYKPRPPVEYLADGLFARGTLNLVFGAPGCLKSLFLADLAIDVAAGFSTHRSADDDPEEVPCGL